MSDNQNDQFGATPQNAGFVDEAVVEEQEAAEEQLAEQEEQAAPIYEQIDAELAALQRDAANDVSRSLPRENRDRLRREAVESVVESLETEDVVNNAELRQVIEQVFEDRIGEYIADNIGDGLDQHLATISQLALQGTTLEDGRRADWDLVNSDPKNFITWLGVYIKTTIARAGRSLDAPRNVIVEAPSNLDDRSEAGGRAVVLWGAPPARTGTGQIRGMTSGATYLIIDKLPWMGYELFKRSEENRNKYMRMVYLRVIRLLRAQS